MKNYTLIGNEIFEQSQLSLPSKFLYCILRKYCGQKDHCFPGQQVLADQMNMTPRMVRHYINELVVNGIIRVTRSGYNRPNTYEVAKELVIDRKLTSYHDQKSITPHVGNKFPFQQGNALPPKNTYRKAKEKKGLDLMRNKLAKTLSMDHRY